MLALVSYPSSVIQATYVMAKGHEAIQTRKVGKQTRRDALLLFLQYGMSNDSADSLFL